MSRPTSEPTRIRMAFFPGVLTAIILLAGLALIGADWYQAIRFGVSILALIMCWFALQAKQWWWLILLLPIAVVWNPVYPIDIPALPLRLLHILAAAAVVVVGLAVKVPEQPEKK